MDEKEKKDKDVSVNKALLALSDGILATGFLTVLGLYGGLFLDRLINTKPWLSMILALLGGMLGLVRLVVKAINLDKDKAEQEI